MTGGRTGVVAGVDSSTQSCKVELRDADTGRLLGTGRAPHPPAFGPESEQDPRDWWRALTLAWGRSLEATGTDPADVRAISIAAQCHGLAALDGHGDPVVPAKLWNDTTTTPELRELRALVDDVTWARRTGTVPTAAFTISKLLHLARTEPAAYQRVRQLMLPRDYLAHRLTGTACTDRSAASGTGYFDSTADGGRGEYAAELLALVDPDRDLLPLLPTVLGPDEAAGTVLPSVAELLGLHPGVLVGAGGGDQHASALGLGTRPGDVVFALGTSGVVFTTSRTSVHDATGDVDGVADMTGGWLPLSSTLNAARVTDTFARLLGCGPAEFAELALAAGPGTGPVLVAHLDGERTPDLPDSRGLLAGITSATTREELARAAHEGVLLGLVNGLDRLGDVGVDLSGTVTVVGGGSRSAAYRQLLADLLQREVLVADPADADEATARGACVQASAVLHGVPVSQVRDAWRPATASRTEPRPTGTRDPRAAHRAALSAAAGLEPWT